MSEKDRSVSFAVVIPTKDRPEETLAAVRSVLGQSVPAKEIIVVDDGSAEVDRLTEELSGIEEVTVLVRGESGGPAVARNAGLAQAQAGWVAFLDSDDVWMSNHLESFREVICKQPRARAVVGSFVVRGRGGRSRVVRAWMPRSGQRRMILRLEAQPFTASAVAVRSSRDSTVRFDENFRVLEDMELIVRLAGTDELVTVSEATVSKRNDSPNRAYRAALDTGARQYLLHKYAGDFESDPVALRRQLRRLALNETAASASSLAASVERLVVRAYLATIRMTARRRSQLYERLARSSR